MCRQSQKIMENTDVLEFLFSHLNLNDFEYATMKSFYTKHKNEGVTLNNFKKKYEEWLESDEGLQVCREEKQRESAREDAQIQKGITSVERGNFHILPHSHQRLTYLVRDNETNLYGLVTDDDIKEEILPCIFTDINVHLDGFIDVTFKGHNYEFTFWGTTKDLTKVDRKSMSDRYFVYAETKVYTMIHIIEDSPITKKLRELLKVNHSVE